MMNNKKIKKRSQSLISLTFNVDKYKDRLKDGIIYTLYSDKFSSINIGFARNDSVLSAKLFRESYILLDKKRGNKKELILLRNTLKELGLKNSEDLNFKYSSSLIRHLSTLGWPVGRSLYKQRKIKKEILCA